MSAFEESGGTISVRIDLTRALLADNNGQPDIIDRRG